MADTFDPDAFLAQSKPFDPDEFLGNKPSGSFAHQLLGVSPESRTGHAISAITDIPGEIYDVAKPAMRTIGRTFNPWSEQNVQSIERQKQAAREGFIPFLREEHKAAGELGSGLMAPLEIAASPMTGTGRSIIGHGLTAATPQMAPYEETKQKADLALMGLRAGPRPAAAVGPPPDTPPFGVMLSEGQETGNIAAIQREQAALRDSNNPAHARAQEFYAQQQMEKARAKEDVSRYLNPPTAEVLAESPREAAGIVQSGFQGKASAAKQSVKQKYDYAKSLPGEFHSAAFEGIGQKIKGDLSLGDSPVIIDDRLTPVASQMIQDIDNRVSRLRIQNRADPWGEPNPERIVGVNLQGVDQMRKRLSSMRGDAIKNAHNNATDARAARAVLEAFDDHVDAAVNNGLFNGDPAAIKAWNAARAAHSDYKSTFTARSNDPVGRVIEKILATGDKASTPNDVADFMYGATGVNPSSLNVNVAKRLKSVLGENSQEWYAAKQGLFERLVNSGEKIEDWGPKKIADRLNKFLNSDGVEMSQVVYSPRERRVLQAYSDLIRKLEVPKIGANWSQTATFTAPYLKKIADSVGGKIGHLIGASAGAFLGYKIGLPAGSELGAAMGVGAAQAIKKIGTAAENKKAIDEIARQMPILSHQIAKWTQAVARANSPSEAQRGAAAVAWSSVATSLQRLGISPQAILAATAQNKKKEEAERPTEGKKHGGAVDIRKRFAHGGRVVNYFHPVQFGAKRAPDRSWYIQDPDRAGKYLRVEKRG